MSAGQQALVTPANSAGNSNYDPYYSNVTLLLSMNGSNNSTSFPDSSQNRLTVTANGGAQISTAQSKFGGSSAYFDGTGDYLTNSNNDLNFGTGDFTIEWWQYSEDVSSTTQRGAFQTSTTAGGLSTSYTTGIVVVQGANGVNPLNGGCTVNILGTYISGTSSSVLITNSWQHIAITRSNGNCRLFVNGVQHGTTTIISGSINATNIAIGGYYNPSFLFRGYIDDFRITKSVARYTANFTPPVFANPRIGPAYDPFYNNVSLLLGMNGSNGSTYFPDNSGSPKIVTANGTAQISTTQWKFGGASAYFDGTTNCYVQSNASADYDLGGGDFTVEFWVYFNSLSGTPHILQFNGANINFRWNLFVGSPIKSLRLYVENGAGTGAERLSTIELVTARWYYITVVKNSGDLYLYLNGTRMGATALVSFPSGNLSLTLGTQFFSPLAGDYLNGYIDDLRITKGVARYTTTSFTPPTAPFANTGPTADPYYDYVSLLLPMNGANASTSFIDSSRTAKAITVSGGAQISTTQNKFGGSSAFFDGNGDYLTAANNADLILTGDFTIEAWIYPTAINNFNMILGSENGPGSDYWTVRANTMELGFANAGLYPAWSNTFTANQWYHIAITRSGTTLRAFVNGTGLTLTVGSATNSTQLFNSGAALSIGRYGNTSTPHYYTGYIDDLRITKGVARYTANFTVPAQPSPITGVQYDNYYDNVSLLLSMNGANNGTSFLDSSPRSKTVTVNGNTITSTAQYKWGVSSGYFDGTGDFLTIPTSSGDFNFGTGNFTIECWIYLPSTPSGSYAALYDNNDTGIRLLWVVDSSLRIGTFITGAVEARSASNALTLNTWTHVALVRNGTTMSIYVNGSSVVSSTASNNFNTVAANIYIGRVSDGGHPAYLGYIDDLRITKGVARYTANFTPPTQAFPDQGPLTDPFYYNTSLLLHMNGTNGSTVFTDASPVAKNVTPSGNAQISTAQWKWGGSSALFDGSGDYLSIPYSSAFDFGNSNFTIECWLYRTGANANSSRIWNSGGDFYGQVEISLDPSGTLGSYGTTQGAAWDAWSNGSIGAIPLNTWTHIALVRNGGTVRAYINGIGTTLTSSLGSSALANGSGASSIRTIGGQPGTDRPYSGYIDDFRVTKGVARYSNNFTPPQQQLPDQ